jgi:hypothetical protein
MHRQLKEPAMNPIDELEARLDALTTAILLPLRSAKHVGPWYGQGPPTPGTPRY